MAIYLKKFETQSAYEAAQSGLILPNVSFTVDNNTVHYNPSTPPTPPIIDGHEYVEIGGLKWATMNVGATGITDGGLYFQWGDTSGYTASQIETDFEKEFYWNDYKWTDDGGETLTKYNDTDGKTVLDAEDDAVTAAWGSNWRMPTKDEFITLGAAVNTAWTSNYESSGVAGLVLTSKADSSKKLFFPAAGECESSNVYSVGSKGGYWSSSLHLSDVQCAYYLGAQSVGVSWQNDYSRYFGYPVRGVVNE